MADAKILGIFGPGGIKCGCCGKRLSRRCRSGKIRAQRKADKARDIRERLAV